MRFTDVIVLFVILGVFSPVFASEITALRKMDCRIEQLREENDSLSFISESFYKTCEGRGFSSLEEWKTLFVAVGGKKWYRDGFLRAGKFLKAKEEWAPSNKVVDVEEVKKGDYVHSLFLLHIYHKN